MEAIDNTKEYLLQRAAQEREMASSSDDICVRSVHLELAQRYEQRAKHDPSALFVAEDHKLLA